MTSTVSNKNIRNQPIDNHSNVSNDASNIGESQETKKESLRRMIYKETNAKKLNISATLLEKINLKIAPHWIHGESDDFVELVKMFKLTKQYCLFLVGVTKGYKNKIDIIEDEMFKLKKIYEDSKLCEGNSLFNLTCLYSDLYLSKTTGKMCEGLKILCKQGIHSAFMSFIEGPIKTTQNSKDHFRIVKSKFFYAEKKLNKMRKKTNVSTETFSKVEYLKDKAESEYKEAKNDFINEINKLNDYKNNVLAKEILQFKKVGAKIFKKLKSKNKHKVKVSNKFLV